MRVSLFDDVGVSWEGGSGSSRGQGPYRADMRMCSLCGYSGALKASRIKVLVTKAVGSRSGRVGSLDEDGDSGSCCGLRSVCPDLEFEFVIVPVVTVLGNETADDVSMGGGSRMESGTRGSNEFRARTSN